MNRPLSSGCRLAVVATVPETLRAFMRLHLEAMATAYSTTAICGGKSTSRFEGLPQSVQFRYVPIERKISLFRDVFALWKLIALFRQERYTVVHSITPKAGLLAMCAAFVCRVPFRVHVFTGQVWATRKGGARYFLKIFDELIAMLATHVLADSASQRRFLIDQGVVDPRQIAVLGDGSICGVDTMRFKPEPDVRKKQRLALELPDGAVVALFLGRLTRDKGVVDLANAFSTCVPRHTNLYLLIVGPDEEDLIPLLSKIVLLCADRVRFVSMTNCPENYMAAADFLCLPSYREGFGSVIIEAGASGIPAIASRIYGLTDAVEEGVTGLLHRPGDVEDIEQKIDLMVTSREMRLAMGERARKRAKDLFSSSRIVADQMAFYEKILSSVESVDVQNATSDRE